MPPHDGHQDTEARRPVLTHCERITDNCVEHQGLFRRLIRISRQALEAQRPRRGFKCVESRLVRHTKFSGRSSLIPGAGMALMESESAVALGTLGVGSQVL